MESTRESQKSLYQKFIINCTSNAKSVKNYSDFKRINECLQQLYPEKKGITILDFDNAQEFEDVIKQLSNQKEFGEFEKKGGNQYSNTLKHYLRFLYAKSMFSVIPLSKDEKQYIIAKQPLQQIFYGAPGTGKSYKIKESIKGKSVIRTTFHPDSDYSTFVGAYKPTTIEVPMRDVTGKVIVENGEPVTENHIVYEFVEQAFLQAYTKAWKKYASATSEGKEPEDVYLVIEEINRGNCAQIFGDLFQLLDRGDNGFSEYPINTDKDMQKQLTKVFADMAFLNAPAINGMSAEKVALKIRNGEILLLPSNLYIWATMNTSDQSLFPIDSAFKRRWEWQYMPITNGMKGWQIEANGKRYDWWQFLQKMNDKIGSTTNSEDKKLGYYFCKAKNGVINAETFVGKVIFYIWNDVFKDFAEDACDLFKDTDESLLSYNKFYTVGDDGKTRVVKDKVEHFLKNLGVESIGKNIEDSEEQPFLDKDGNDTTAISNRQFDYSKYSINGNGAYPKGSVAQEAIKLYVSNNPNISADEVVNTWLGLNIKIPNIVETEQMFYARTSGSSDKGLRTRYKMVEMANGDILYVSNQYNVERINEFMDKVNSQPWGIHIAKIEA